MIAFVSEKNEFQKRLFWLSNYPDAAILNNCDVTCCPIVLTQRAIVVEQ